MLKLPENWQDVADKNPDLQTMLNTIAVKVDEKYKNETVYPPQENIFRALELCPIDELKVVILGQDPYHGQGQAHGPAFSVLNGKAPPSLENIQKEVMDDMIENGKIPDIKQKVCPTNLESWGRQGVLLLNCTLTVRAHSANSHVDLGWGEFTDRLINIISQRVPHVVFILWGSFAQRKQYLIERRKDHLVLKSVHPSPLSAYRGFFGCRHFSACNTFLQSHGLKPIDWLINK